MSDTPSNDPELSEAQALRAALQQLLQPLAALAVAKGVTYAQVEDLLQESFVQAAQRAHPDLLPHRMVSRVSTTTGLNRRLVTQLLSRSATVRQVRRSPASELRLHWLTDPAYRKPRGGPKVLPRQGPAPSFESLAQQMTKDVHPRSLLDEMVRLGLATLDAKNDTVALVVDAFNPGVDGLRLLGFLGDNVGDHLRAAVHNVQVGGGAHLERAIFADGLSKQSVDEMGELVRVHWQQLVEGLVPELRKRIAQDETEARGPATQRLRVGLFSFNDVAKPAATEEGKRQ
jgi:Family of unknown function (DUF6502)